MITMKDITREGHPALRAKSVDVELPLSLENKQHMEDMIDYIFNSIDPEISKKYNLRPAVGLAAPQIGLNLKMLVIYCYDESGKEHFYPMINPKILSYSEEMTYLDSVIANASTDTETINEAQQMKMEKVVYL